MQKLKEIAQETGFRPAVRDELIKFIFVTHNTDQKVRGGTHPRQSRREHYEVERTHYPCGHSHCSGPESDYELHEDTVQIVYNTTNAQTNIKFDEISNSQALGDLNLSNRAGKNIT